MFTNFWRGVFKLLPWRLQTFAVVFANFCRDVHKLLSWCLQTFAVAFTNFCRGVHKLLPWCLQTFAVVFTNFCRDVYKLLPWYLWATVQITANLEVGYPCVCYPLYSLFERRPLTSIMSELTGMLALQGVAMRYLSTWSLTAEGDANCQVTKRPSHWSEKWPMMKHRVNVFSLRSLLFHASYYSSFSYFKYSTKLAIEMD